MKKISQRVRNSFFDITFFPWVSISCCCFPALFVSWSAVIVGERPWPVASPNPLASSSPSLPARSRSIRSRNRPKDKEKEKATMSQSTQNCVTQKILNYLPTPDLQCRATLGHGGRGKRMERSSRPVVSKCRTVGVSTSVRTYMYSTCAEVYRVHTCMHAHTNARHMLQVPTRRCVTGCCTTW